MAQAKRGDTVHVHYRGTLDDGTEFDSSSGSDPFSRMWPSRSLWRLRNSSSNSFSNRPTSVRQLSIWLSPRDCLELVRCSLAAPAVGFTVVYGVSANTRSWWKDEAAARLGYHPQDDAEEFAPQIEEPEPEAAARLAHRLQGGSFVEYDPSR